MQTRGDLAVGTAQAGQSRHILLARGKGLPLFPQAVIGYILGQAGAQEFRE